MYKSNNFYIYDTLPDFNPTLVSCWQVTCSENYSYMKTKKVLDNEPQKLLCAIRTIKGEGKIITNSAIYTLTSDTLIFLPNKEIVKYISSPAEWSYTWYNFLLPDAIPYFDLCKIYTIPVDIKETDITIQMFDIMNMYNLTNSKIATLLFSLQLYYWIYSAEHKQGANNQYFNEISDCILYINLHLNENLNISELAKKYNFSERHFRNLFKSIIGESPKTYQSNQRMQKAKLLLKNTSLSINNISDELGFYSQFQFCNNFKKAYGISPSQYRSETQK